MLGDKILKDYQEAMKSRDSVKSTLLSCVRSEIANAALKDKTGKLDDNGIINVVRKLIKQHQDSIEQFQKGGRTDLVEKEAAELKVLEVYLPPQLSADEIKKAIEEAVAATGAASLKDMGKVMKEALAKVGSGADSKLVSDLVKARLTPKPPPASPSA